MRWVFLAVACVAVAASGSMAAGQQRVARTPAAAAGAAPNNVSQGQAAIQRAAAANKYVFIFFWKERNQQTDKAWGVFQPAISKMSDSADTVSIQATNPAEKPIVDRFGVSRSPMPLVLAIAPCGAITKAFAGTFDEKQLRTALVSPCTQRCLKALQDRKLVLLCVADRAAEQGQVSVPQGVRDFKADERYAAATEIVAVNARDEGEAAFLKDFQIDAKTPKPITVFLAPPGSLIGKFDGTATKQQLVAKLAAAQSSCCPGGQCGPNGCGPKK